MLYKWLLLVIVPFCLFLFFLLASLFTPTARTQPEQTEPTAAPSIASDILTPIPGLIENPDIDSQHAPEENPETEPGFIKKVNRSDGLVEYSFTSPNPKRPNILIATKELSPLFQRKLTQSSETPETITMYKDGLGEPEKIINGSTFYGPEASIYIYGTFGLAFIANSQTGLVYEQQLFTPMSANAYLQRFGNQN